MQFTLKPLTPILGAEVTGIDLAQPIDQETRRALHDAWISHAVLVIRDQNLTPPQFAEAARIFGDILEQQLKKFTLPDHPEVGTISSRDLPITDGKLHPFKCPVVGQDGKEVECKGGAHLDDGQILGMNFYVKGIDEKIPGK